MGWSTVGNDRRVEVLSWSTLCARAVAIGSGIVSQHFYFMSNVTAWANVFGSK